MKSRNGVGIGLIGEMGVGIRVEKGEGKRIGLEREIGAEIGI